MNRRRTRRMRNQKEPELDITAFMNLMVILVPFLLITASFSRFAILQLNLPAAASASTVDLPKGLQLEIIIHPKYLVVADRSTGPIQQIDKKEGGYDFESLSQLLQQIKTRYPDKTKATILLQPETPYDSLVQVYDVTRQVNATIDGQLVAMALFPEISIGDAPLSRP